MTEAITHTPRLPEANVDEVVTYRAVSPLALVSLLLSLVSALALVHPILWVLPPVAALLALYALRVVTARQAELTGRGAALAALFLAILFGVWAPVRVFSREYKVYAQARALADEWFRLVREGRYYEAHELHLKPNERQTSDRSLADFYGELTLPFVAPVPTDFSEVMHARPQDKIRSFFGTPNMQTLLAAPADAKVVFLENESQFYRADALADDVVLRYELRYTQDGQPRTLPLRIVLTRAWDARVKKAFWNVESVGEPQASPP